MPLLQIPFSAHLHPLPESGVVLSPPPWEHFVVQTSVCALYTPTSHTFNNMESLLMTVVRERTHALATSRGFTEITGDHTAFTALDPQGQKCLLWCSTRSLKAGSFTSSISKRRLHERRPVMVVARWRNRKPLQDRHPLMEVWILDLAKIEDRFVQSPDGSMQILSAPRA